MMKRFIYTLLLLALLPVVSFAQLVRGDNLKISNKSKLIGDVTVGSSSFESSSALTVTATDQGMLVPRMTTVQRDAIGSPADGLLIYNIDNDQFEFFQSTWQAVGAGGNTIYTADDNVTSDRTVTTGTNDLTFATTGESNLLEIDGDNDRIGIGIATPLYRLQIETTTNDAIPAFAIRTGGNNAVELWNGITDGGGILTRKAAGTISMSLGLGSSDFINTGSDLSIGFSASAAARLNIRGVNAASTSDALLVEDNVGTDLFIIENAGDVGIGLTDPTAQLHINTTNSFGSQFLLESNNTSGTAISIKNTSVGGRTWTIFSNGSGNLGGAGHIQFFDGAKTPFFFHEDGMMSISKGASFVPLRLLELRATGNDDGISLSISGTFQAFLQTSSIGGYLQLRASDGVTSVVRLNDHNATHDFINTSRNFGVGLILPIAQLHVLGDMIVDSVFSIPTKSLTLGVAVTTFIVQGNKMEITGDGGANSITTITGGIDGMTITLTFVDALVTLTDDNSSTANTINLPASFTSTANDVVVLEFGSGSWRQVSQSVN